MAVKSTSPINAPDTVEREARRLHIATIAITALLADDSTKQDASFTAKLLRTSEQEVLALYAFRIADAMLDEAAKSLENRERKVSRWRKKMTKLLAASDQETPTP